MLTESNALATEIATLTIAHTEQVANSEALKRENQQTLSKLESVIQKGEAAFFASSKAIIEIIDGRLFAPTYSDKTSYFRERWDMSPQNVSRFENAGRVLNKLAEEGFEKSQLPKNEGQCRELYKQSWGPNGFDGTRLIEIWNKVVDSEKVTAKLIEDIATQTKPSVADDKWRDLLAEDLDKDELLVEELEAPQLRICSTVGDESIPNRPAKLIIRTKSAPCNFGFQGSAFETTGQGEHELAFEGSALKELLQQLVAWDGIDEIERLLVTI